MIAPAHPAPPPRRADRDSHEQLLAALLETYDRPDQAPSLRWMTRKFGECPPGDARVLPSRFRILKRCLDVALASTMLVLLAPLLLVTAALVKLTSRGPIVYRQVRVGLNRRRTASDRRTRAGSGADRRSAFPRVSEFPVGRQRSSSAPSRASDRRIRRAYGRHFVIYKFRTMHVDAERHGARFAERGDPRVTTLGRFLRRTRIDELPQLWNVLLGDMSLVGPRPERPEFVEQLAASIPEYPRRLTVKPGLTGIAQVVNGYDNDLLGFRRKVLFDLIYLENGCLRNDLKILVRTVRVVVTGEGAV